MNDLIVKEILFAVVFVLLGSFVFSLYQLNKCESSKAKELEEK